ncbi:MAG TPA: ABC transporter permease, partial [Polyangiaceae bacterium]|nr:ABC transporter permease [Polyangiaceae bacterium]
RLLSSIGGERPVHLPVVGAEHAPRLIEYLKTNGVQVSPPPPSPEESVRRGDVDAVLVIDQSYAERFVAGRTAPLRLIVDESRSDTSRTARRVTRLVYGYAQRLGALRLIARGLSPEVATPIQLDEIDLSTPQKLAANVLTVVPLFLMLAALVGGMNVAIDTTAGERERGSLEPLLLNPVRRRTLVVGKWLATSLFSVAVASVTLAGFMLTVFFLPLEELGMKVLLGPREALSMWVGVLPLALFGAALQMTIATFARSFKEAQTYLNLLNLLPMAPSMFLMLEPTRTAAWMLPVPALAQVSTLLDVMRGEAVPVWHHGLIGVSSLAYTGLCLGALVRLLGREQIIFGRP